MENDDRVGRVIYPQNLDRVLGIRFTSASQLAARVGISIDQSRRAIRYLESTGFVETWVAPQCEGCGYIWPLCKESEEAEAPDEDCPICEHPISQGTKLYIVYRLVREIP